jgi:uncharacterized lipoprotein YbaY
MAQVSVKGQVTFPAGSAEPFKGNETLKVSVVDASRADAKSTSLGVQTILLQSGQSFPIEFDVSYDSSRVGRGPGGSLLNARIEDDSGNLLYWNDTRTPVADGVQIKVVKI